MSSSTAARLRAVRLPGEHDAYMEQFLNRTTILLGDEAVKILAGKTVAIAGCGGVGGAAAITLARLGVGGFTLADPGIFDPPDINRQWAAGRPVLGRNKAEVHEELLRGINPTVRLRTFKDGVTPENLDDFLDGADLMVDCLDISVPVEFRSAVYRAAMEKGIYAVSAPIFGFGTLILFAEPGGMGMDQLIEGFIHEASTRSRLPAGFPDHYFVPHVQAIEERIHTHKVPSSAIAPVVATGLVCSEIALIFLGELYPNARRPVALPDVLVVDPLRGNYEVLDYRELFESNRMDRSGEWRANETPEEAGRAQAARRELLEAAHHNVVMVPAEAVALDFLTDSWADLAGPEPRRSDADPDAIPGLLQDLYGYAQCVPVFRGRFAEALVAPALVEDGRIVATNSLFPTTRYHVEAAGGEVAEIPVGQDGDGPFQGNIDLLALGRLLAGGQVGAVYVELCPNGLGGHPVSISNLRGVRDLCSTHSVPVILDATRAYENAVLIRHREYGYGAHSVTEIVREICSLSDGCTASLTKDFRVSAGGFVGLRYPERFPRVRELATLMIGDGLSEAQRRELARVLERAVDDEPAVEARVAAVQRMARALEEVGVPVQRPLGGHAVYVDARALAPHLGADQNAAAAVSAAIFEQSGVRVGPHMGEGELIRVAVPVERHPAGTAAAAEAFRRILGAPDRVRGLRRRDGWAEGVLEEFAPRYEVE